ncbi:exodeoxyribonuclease VII small subunit [Spiroplasma endosymbiont of Panorpa germanica]|uniref:exodeoxyribonuclease VII small subunit n=1 Tax=Spiroplasma endosymbiont of Panorpa germanica TaxID=3066314 RepID=UPI0030CAF6DC
MSNYKDKGFDELLTEIKDKIEKLDSSQINMEDSIKIFKESLEIIKEAKDKLENIKGEVKKVMADNKVVDFEN